MNDNILKLAEDDKELKDVYKKIMFDHNFMKPTLLDALDTVKQFVIDRKLILVGGMAIDFALRLKGDSLYNENEIPDYDMYSTESWKDAYELTDILHKQSIPELSAIVALHPTTMRVRTQFEAVADISYVPENLLKNIPTLIWNKMRIVHPHYQFIDQHRSLSRLYDNPPVEVVFERLTKDIKRHNMLRKHYPMKCPDIKIKTKTIEGTLSSNILIGGFLAYSIYYDMLSKITKTDKLMKSIVMFDTNKVKFDIPEGMLITYYSENPETLVEELKLTDIKQINPIRDIINKQYSNSEYEIIDHKGMKFMSYDIEINENKIAVLHPQGLLCYFLAKYYQTMDEVYKRYYYDTTQIIIMAEDYAGKLDDEKKSQFIANSPFFLTANAFGSHIESHSYEIMKADFDEMIVGTPVVDSKPRNFYPKQKERDESYEFDPNSSKYFRIDGLISTI